MSRIGFVLLCVAIFACKGKKSEEKDANGFSYENFSGSFRALSLPYELSDTSLLHNRDTASIQAASFNNLISDSIKTKLFGKGSKVRYVSLGRIKGSKGTSFYLVKATSGSKRAALLLAFNEDQYGGLVPFLVPDTDPTTSQVSTIDKSLSIQENISQKKADNNTVEGKDVYEYYPDRGKFSLILTNPINHSTTEIFNPIDSFPRKHKFAGDYVKDKKNFVSVRDGRYPSQLRVFIHMEKNDGSCTGELKGDLLLTSSTTAIYRQGGDPCVMTLRFGPSSVSVSEDEGCGSHRGLDCVFDGTYAKKKEPKTKAVKAKK